MDKPLMDKPVLPDFPPTLPNLMANARSKFPDQPFLVCGDQQLTYAEADARSAELARGMLAAGIGKATRVAILMPNSPDWVLCWLAASRIGAITFPVSTLFQPRELAWLLDHADIDTLLVTGHYAGHDYMERLERAIPGLAAQRTTPLAIPSHPYLRRVVAWGDTSRAWALRGPDDVLALAAARPAIDNAFLASVESKIVPSDSLLAICTSGSTAEPKVVLHSHSSALLTPYMHLTYKVRNGGMRDFVGMPLFWLGGLNVNLIPGLFEGACLVFSPTPKTDDILDTIVRHKVNRVNMWMTQRKALFDRAAEKGINLAAMVGDITEPRDADGNIIPMNRRVSSILGMTESFGPHGVEWRNTILPESRAGSLGHAVEGIERRIVDQVSGAVLAPGETGELQIRGFTLMQGYYKKARDEVFTRDGWFSTGDLCHLDADGYIYFHSRRSEMIKSMGANIAPREVELQLESLPGVREAIVFGVPDEKRGESVMAVVVPLEGQKVDGNALRAGLKDRLSSYKVPDDIIVARFEDIPRTDSGKSKKNELRKILPTLKAAAAGKAATG